MKHRCFLAVALLAFVLPAFAQSQPSQSSQQQQPAASGKTDTTVTAEPEPPSLGDLARKKRASEAGTKPKVVLDENTVKTKPRPIPAIFTDGIDNSDQILKAITAYRASHTPAELEATIHTWYDEFDEQLRKAIEENKKIETAVEPTVTSETEYQYEVESRKNDLLKRKENGLLSARIQNVFTEVRNGLLKMNIHYEWFKIRCGNGNCSF